MRTKLGSLFCVGGWALSLGGGCDAQVAPDYFGEPLLTVMGSAEIANSRTRGKLSPALGFSHGPAITIVEVPVRGNFPSNFSIEMYEPPPESTLHHPTYQEEGEPLVGIGYITAVTSDHPDVLYTANSVSVTFYGCLDEGRPDNLCLRQTEENCVVPNPDHVPCYVEKHFCAMDNPDDDDRCIVETSGDPALTLFDITAQFAGLSRNYQVIYLTEAAAPGSVTAAWLEAKEGVPAGYGLYEVRPVTSDEEDCQFEDALSWELVTRYYNEAHNTDYKSVECNDSEADPPYCHMLTPDDDIEGRTGAHGEINRFLEKARIELGCSIGGHYKRVDDPANTAISILIDSQPPLRMQPPTQP